MTQQELVCFLTVFETQNFTVAARQLFLTQPAVSRQVQHLEKELGIILFTRYYHRTVPTSEAEILAPQARRLLQDFRRLRYSAQGLNRATTDCSGKLRIGLYFAGEIMPIMNLIRLFSRQFPNVEVTTQAYLGEELWQALDQNKIDVAFSIRESRTGIRWVPQLEDEFVVWQSASQIPPRKKAITPAELSHKIRIDVNLAQNGYYQQLLQRVQEKLPQARTLSANSVEAAIMNLTTLNAYTVLPSKLIRSYSEVQPLKINGLPQSMTRFQVGLAYAQTPTAVVQQFVDYSQFVE
ncbi:LysR family transcriptional regulator [Levilactobacillus namurensis]|uniref:LysR family transcriptional regulator n=1 Tax=Levilactobacillus namurensis TaxID=380393 RepID=UPI0022314A83|nr:LysR family transcriptional regulator [Levilactobacillus namurensis]MCW3778900.1 LysR family transcriptional regulator [Levilactobacillus namurensis]MDT7017805.1 LysR family transcriptional regulator [Levilactobacillus namurensis]WNN65194.1 LysR family transcriptional regulator [Levilactobacillus namurensis]